MNAHEVKSFNTRKKIVNYVIDELNEKENVEISYSNICRDLGISRTTIYSHFPYISDIYDEIHNELKIEERKLYNSASKMEEPVDVINEVLDFIVYNKKYITISFKTLDVGGKHEFNDILLKLIHEKLKIEEGNDLADRFLLNGIFGFIAEWVQGGKTNFHRQDIINLILNVLNMYHNRHAIINN